MLRSMYSGISGMKNFQTKLDVIGNNIANVNTYGFKKGRVTFKDAMSQTISGASAATQNRGGKNPTQVGLGSTLATIDTIHEGSSTQTTNRQQDLAIQGDGYFVVKQGNAQYYTRAGNLYLDNNGTLVNGDGYKVQAYQVNAAGQPLNTYGDVAINVNAVLPATPTKQIGLSGNFDKDAIVGTIVSQQMKVVDATGNEHVVDVYYKKTAKIDTNATPAVTNDTWKVYFGGVTKEQLETGDPTSPLTINFNASGSVASTTPPNLTTSVNVNIGTGNIPVNIQLDDIIATTGGITAFSSPDGYTEGKLESFSIGQMGEINGVYSNGEVTTLGRLAIAKFSNTAGLSKAGGNLFQETINSGTANINVAGDGRGTIASGALEMSNVDLSEEFTEMITAQRGFQANTRIITTSDEILQELVNLKR